MKFTTTVPETPAPLTTYPRLMVATGYTRTIVLFISRERGLRLSDDGFRAEEEGWMPADGPHWTPFTGTITVTP